MRVEKHGVVSNGIKGIVGVSSCLIIVGFMLFGCAAVGPDYVPPGVSTPEKWNASSSGGIAYEPDALQTMAHWWTTLDDPILSSLIDRALQGSLDLRIGVARVREARARRGIINADRFPTINAKGSAIKSRSSEETGSGVETDLYAVGFDAGWEVDVFGGVRRSVEAADAALEASSEGLHAVMVSLLAEVGLNYVELRSLQTRLAIAEANQNAQKETYEITQARYGSGLTSELDVEQAKYSLQETRSQIPPLTIGIQQAENRLAVLLGQKPGTLKSELIEPAPVPVTPIEVAVGVPAEALRRRPDVRKAERLLAAQTARVGVATAELYPRFSLMGTIGLEALSFEDVFSSGSRKYGIGPSFHWNIFDSGRIRQNIEVQSALQEQALLSYESSVLGALADVENALVAYANEQMRRQSLVEGAQAAQRAVTLSQNQYTSGLIDFQNVLNAQRALFSLQSQQAQSDAAVTSNLISLYKALGGGWTSLDPALVN
jgi:NodT family efflux transporter outer membrane factor (OMF) lipoprotein